MAVLAKHGLAAVGSSMGSRSDEARDHVRAEQMRAACEELGPTFIKLGQVLSTRGDLLSDEYRVELAKLQDAVPPVPTAEIENEIVQNLGASPEVLFAHWDPEPMASASIGQVHRARLSDGRAVVVKVRKPGVRALVEVDLDILTSLAASSEKHFPDLVDYDVPGLVAEFQELLRAELDYTREGRNVEQFASFFKGDEGFVFPAVIWEYSTAHVLTLTEVDGERATEAPALSKKRREAVAQRIARFVLEPAFMHGVFQADPHAGNIAVRPDGTIGLVDFGMVGRLTDETRRHLGDLFVALDRRDVQRFCDRLIDVAPPSRPMNRVALTQDLGRLLDRYMSDSLERVELGKAMEELLELVRRHALHLPGAVAMLFKAIAMSEGLLVSIDPDKTIQDYIRPISQKIALARLAPDEWRERLQSSAMDAAELSIELPRRADRVLGDIERGNLRVWARIEDLEPTLVRLERMVERVNVTLIAAACIVGLAVLTIYYHPHGWFGVVSGIVWVAIAIAIIAVLRIAWSALRKGG